MAVSDHDLESLICSPSRLRTLTDADLMAALCAGCNDALAVLFERHSVLVFRTARAILRDDSEMGETVQRGVPSYLSGKESAMDIAWARSLELSGFNEFWTIRCECSTLRPTTRQRIGPHDLGW